MTLGANAFVRSTQFVASQIAANSERNLAINTIKTSQVSKTPSQANGEFYSVAFKAEISSTSYPGLSRYRHFQEANSALLNLMEGNKEFSQRTESSEAKVLREPESGRLPNEAESAGLIYFLEVSIANDFLQDWSASCEKAPDSRSKCLRLIQYAINDA